LLSWNQWWNPKLSTKQSKRQPGDRKKLVRLDCAAASPKTSRLEEADGLLPGEMPEHSRLKSVVGQPEFCISARRI